MRMNIFLFVKQIAVSSRARSSQNQLSVINSINQEPVRLYMTFPKTDVVASKRMVSVFFIKFPFGKKRVDDRFQQGHIFPLLLHPLIVLSKLRGCFQ